MKLLHDIVPRLIMLLLCAPFTSATEPPGPAPCHISTITASDGANVDIFGHALAVDGDVLLVGAPWHDHPQLSTGAAYIFRLTGGEWIEEAELLPDDVGLNDTFGASVTINGNVAVVGMPEDDDFGGASGAAYVFTYDNGVWIQSVKLHAPDAMSHSSFGKAVAMSDDLIVVGSPGRQVDGTHVGAAYVFRLAAGEWVYEATLESTVPASTGFGSAVDISGHRIAVGASGDDVVAGNAGAAYVFLHSDEMWALESRLTPPDIGGGDQFGLRVAIDGDTLVASAINDDEHDNTAECDRGVVVSFRRRCVSSGLWREDLESGCVSLWVSRWRLLTRASGGSSMAASAGVGLARRRRGVAGA